MNLVSHISTLFSAKKDDRCFCFLEAPTKQDIEKHHNKLGLDCDYILEVNSTAESEE